MAGQIFLEQQLPLFQALSSPLRLEILKQIIARSGQSIRQIAEQMHLPLSTLSPHITKLESCGLIRLVDSPAAHGVRKCCYPNMERILIDFAGAAEQCTRIYQAEIPVGTYSDFCVKPTCGLATELSFLGTLDEPRLFTHPDRRRARILWFTTGYVEYLLPNQIPPDSVIESLSLSFELSSEAPRYNNNWPSTIEFSLNGTELGKWVCPGDFGGRRGLCNPDWWYDFLNQYGILKRLTINEQGCFLDEERISDVTASDLGLNAQSVMKLRFSVPEGLSTSRGLTIYGQGFGDHNQDIRMLIHYRPHQTEAERRGGSFPL